MPLGNNRDYKTMAKKIRGGLKRHKFLMDLLIKDGLSREEASKKALKMMKAAS